MGAIILFLIIFFFYFLPTIVANSKDHTKVNSIVIVNLFLGWTVIGWIVCLAWAFSEDGKNKNTQKCPQCAEPIKKDAKKCRYCQCVIEEGDD